MCKRCKDEGRVHARDERQFEVEREPHVGRRKKKEPKLTKHRIQCWGCGFMLGYVETIGGKWSTEWIEAVSKKFGSKTPFCKDCLGKRAARALA